jgi:hypothetical protein
VRERDAHVCHRPWPKSRRARPVRRARYAPPWQMAALTRANLKSGHLIMASNPVPHRLYGVIRQYKEKYFRENGVDIAVIDDSDALGFAASATRIEEVYMSDIKSMVSNVLKVKSSYKIRRLDIIDHGNPYWVEFGKDKVGLKSELVESLKKHISDITDVASELSKLTPHFENNGFVHLQHCSIGQNRQLMVAFAKLWNVPVYAGTSYHRPVIRRQDGTYMRADPNGAYYPGGRPDEDMHAAYVGMRAGEESELFRGSGETLSTKFSSSAKEAYPEPSDYYLTNLLSAISASKNSSIYDRHALQLVSDFSKGLQNKSPRAQNLYARLAQRKAGDKVSNLFHQHLKPVTRAALIGILHSKL